MRFDDLYHNRIKSAEPYMRLKGNSKGVVETETMANTLDGLVWRKPLCMKERSVSAQPSDSDLDSFRDEKRVVDVAS